MLTLLQLSLIFSFPHSSCYSSPGLHHSIVCGQGLCIYVLWLLSSHPRSRFSQVRYKEKVEGRDGRSFVKCARSSQKGANTQSKKHRSIPCLLELTYIYLLAPDPRGRERHAPEHMQQKGLGEFWESLTRPRLGRHSLLSQATWGTLPRFLWALTGPGSSPSLLPLPDPAQKHVQHEFLQTSTAFKILTCLKSPLLDTQH